jgi:signal peptidase I
MDFLRKIGLWPRQSSKTQKKPETFMESVISIATAVAIALVIRTFAFQPFVIPSGSMKPGLLIGDFVFVSKYTYGFSRYSFPLSPDLFDGRIAMDRQPRLGEVVVFRGPYDPDTDYIKRVVGLPGDRIQMKEGILHINDKPCPVEPVGEFEDDVWVEGANTQKETRMGGWGEVRHLPQYWETLPNGVRHLIVKKDRFGEGMLDNTQEYVVPAGHYFMMGDNRDESGDSRILRQIGYVPEDHLVGKAQLIWLSSAARWWAVWEWIPLIRFNRLFKRIH